MTRRLKSRATAPITRRIGSMQLRAYPQPPGPEVPLAVMTSELFASTLNARTENRRRFGRSISMDVIESALQSAQRGSMRNLTDILRETIETDPHLGSILNKRFGAVSSLPFEVQPASGAGVDRDKAMFYAEVVRQQLKNMKSFRANLNQLAWSLFDGRACLELQWVELLPGTAPANPQFGTPFIAVQEMNWIHPRRLSFGPERELRIQPENVNTGGTFASSGIDVRALPDKFVWWTPQLFGEYPEREGLGIRCMYWSFFKRFAARERMILTELFGKPWRIVSVDEESTAGSDELKAADKIVDALGATYTARMPRGTKLEVISPSRNAGQVHGEVIKESDQQNSKLVLGQTGTTDGVPAGLNSNQANVMQDEQLGVLIRDAGWLSEVVEAFITDRMIAVNFGELETIHAPTYSLRADLPADRVAELARLQGALNAGLPVSRTEAYEISGFSIPEPDEVVVRMVQPPTSPNSPVAPAIRPEIVYPSGEAPIPGELEPEAPSADKKPTDGASPAGAADAGSSITVNEDRKSRGLDPLLTPEGALDPRGDLTIKEFNALIEAANAPPTPTPEPVNVSEDSPLGLSRVALIGLENVADEIAEGEQLYGEAGIHAHILQRNLESTAIDGPHSHVFLLPSGEFLMTEIDGAHTHKLPNVDADSTASDGEHQHMIDLGGIVVGTGTGIISAHSHSLQVSATAVDGVHRHTLEIADPENPGGTMLIRSLTAGEFVSALREQQLPDFIDAKIHRKKRKIYGAESTTSTTLDVAKLVDCEIDHSLAVQLVDASNEHTRETEEWRVWVDGGDVVMLELGQDQQRTANGSPEDYVVKGMRELTNQTSAWATAFEDAVEGEITATGIFSALVQARSKLEVGKFGRALERRKLQSLMLGVLDNAREISGVDPNAGEDTIADVVERSNEIGDTADAVEEGTSEQLDQLVASSNVKLAATLASMNVSLAAADDEFTKKPFAEAVKFFKSLNVLDRLSFERATAAIKQRSFTVAGIMGDQSLRVIQDELTKAILAGDDLRTFKKNIRPRLKSAGIVGQLIGAPGRQKPALSASHVETVYRTNVLNTYNTGRFVHQSSPAVVAAFPVWEFRSVRDSRSRDTHKAVHGKKLLANDPFWMTAYPPYGFNCIPYSGKVMTIEGERPIGEVEIGDVVLSGKGRWRPVEDIHVNDYNGELVVLEIENGRTLQLTPNHKVLTVERGWVEAGALTETDQLVAGQSVFEQPSEASIRSVCEPLQSHS